MSLITEPACHYCGQRMQPSRVWLVQHPNLDDPTRDVVNILCYPCAYMLSAILEPPLRGAHDHVIPSFGGPLGERLRRRL